MGKTLIMTACVGCLEVRMEHKTISLGSGSRGVVQGIIVGPAGK